MKKQLQIFLTAVLFWTAFSGQINAQTCSGGTSNIPPNGSLTVNGVIITSASTGDVATLPYSWSSCNSTVRTSPAALLVGSSSVGAPTPASAWSVTLNFNKPVNNIVFILTATGNFANEDFRFVSDGGTISITSTNNCYSTIVGNTILSGLGAPAAGGGGIFRITAPSAITTLTINGAGGDAGSVLGVCSASIVPVCSAGTTAPTVNTTPLANNCNATPSNTVNLAAAHTGTAPTNTSVVWYNGNNPATATLVSNPSAVGTLGTYYAFYKGTLSGVDCFSPPSSAVTVNITPCPTCNAGTTAPSVNAAISNNCASATPTTADLNTAHTGTAPLGTTLVWFDGSNPLTATQITTPGAVGAGVYYAFYKSTTIANCFSPSSAVTVTINTCPTCTTSGVISVNLNSLYTGTLPHPDVDLVWFTNPNHTGTPVPNPTNITVSGTYYAFFFDRVIGCYNTDNSTAAVTVNILPPCNTGCFKPGILDNGNTYPTKHGITALSRAGVENENWPMARESAWTVLEAKTKGFVINRVKFNASNLPVADNGTTLVITNPVEGMIVYDTTNNCLKVYTSTDGVTFAWYCMATEACPQ